MATPADGLRVLVVDDHDVVHWGFRLLLERQTWVKSCAAATGGDDALQQAARLKPHVALVDLFLSGESGAEVAERSSCVCAALAASRVDLSSSCSASFAIAGSAAWRSAVPRS